MYIYIYFIYIYIYDSYIYMCIFAYIIIKEPWATPNRATPKSCYP